MAMLAGGRLQLAFQQALQMSEALGMAENGFERLGFAKQNGGCSGCKRAKCHDQTPEVTERHGSRKHGTTRPLLLPALPIKSTTNFLPDGLKFSKTPLF
jgi:hypothetical protein